MVSFGGVAPERVSFPGVSQLKAIARDAFADAVIGGLSSPRCGEDWAADFLEMPIEANTDPQLCVCRAR
jgi:hypothetical protein